MSVFNFGQPDGGVIQTAFITDDIERDMLRMTEQLGIGPWFLFENFKIDNLHYRGKPADFGITLALGNSGHMQFELVQQLDDKPSVYRDVRLARGYGLHHFAVGVKDFDAACRRTAAQGFEMALSGVAGVGARLAYFDTLAVTYAMVEFIEVTEPVEALWRLIHNASVAWDGSDPVRTL